MNSCTYGTQGVGVEVAILMTANLLWASFWDIALTLDQNYEQ